MTTRITVKTESYNQRRFGKPWIARVTFDAAGKAEYTWGEWIGDHRTGSEGLLVINADEGDIIARGQKDFRQPKYSVHRFYQVRDGKLVKLASKVEAYKLAAA